MKKRCLLLYVASFLLATCSITAQVNLQIRVNSANDDLEEFLPGSTQTKTVGSTDNGSSDLELGCEAANNVDPLLVGMRFTGISIPKGAYIKNAYLQFTVDAFAKNTDPCNLFVFGESEDNAVTFDPAIPFNLSSRKFMKDSIPWNITTAWNVVGAAGAEQRSTNIAKLIQQIVDRGGWNSGNALALYIKGSGLREVESFDGSPGQAPLLVIEYFPTVNLQTRVSAIEDDLEEYLPGATQTKVVGSMDNGSSDLELGCETAANVDPQLVGIRFAKLNIPKNAKITSAFMRFTVDAFAKNTDPCNLIVKAQDSNDPLSFDPNTPFNISSRPVLKDSVLWNVVAGSWKTVGSSGSEQTSSDLATLVQQLISRPNWQSGNAMVFTISGNGLREAESFDGSPDQAPLLEVNYIAVNETQVRVSANEDDLEEYLPGATQTKVVGSMDNGSSDLELGCETAGNVDPQLVGIRFASVNLKPSAEVTDAYIQFTNDAIGKNTDPTNLVIKIQSDVNSKSFDSNEPFNISKRPTISDSVIWNIPVGSWKVVGAADLDQRSPNIASLINKVVSNPNWIAGSPLTFVIYGSGLRESESYDGSPNQAPLLVINALSSGCTAPVASAFPIAKKSNWSYKDDGQAVSANWTALNHNDTCWTNAIGSFGFGLPAIDKTLSFGPDAGKKHLSYYFRKRFNIADVNSLSDNVEVNVRANDGFVLYANELEVVRYNMPTGKIDSATLALTAQKPLESTVYYTFDIPKNIFKNGLNVLAVEVHQASAQSSDLAFDLELQNQRSTAGSVAQGCVNANDDHISCFTSTLPREQNDTVQIPTPTHVMQFLTRTGTAYTTGNETVPSNFDFTGFVPINGSSREGYLSINHEKDPGGVSMLKIRFEKNTGLWLVDSIKKVDFTKDIVKTASNCSGTVTPWNTIITCEETTTSGDANGDGYEDLGWNIEIDPETAEVREYGNNKKEKLWAMGRMSHENVVVKSDLVTAYYGEDASTGNVWKFVADRPRNLSIGTLYVLKLEKPLLGNEPQTPVGRWVRIPNNTKDQCNNVLKAAVDSAATTFVGVEDVEISPKDGKIYFAVKGNNRVYRFKDNGATVSDFETFVGGKNYRINTGDKTTSEDWGSGNDNLTFDDRGNLYVLQDGGKNFVWMVLPDHTQSTPRVELFMHTPAGSEPTGMTFTPDFRYMFLSIQTPNANVPQKDVAGNSFTYNTDVTLVISRKEFLGTKQNVSIEDPGYFGSKFTVHPNPFSEALNFEVTSNESTVAKVIIFDLSGKAVDQFDAALGLGSNTFTYRPASNLPNGIYFVKMSTSGNSETQKIIYSRF